MIRRFIAIAGQHLKRGRSWRCRSATSPAVQRRRHHYHLRAGDGLPRRWRAEHEPHLARQAGWERHRAPGPPSITPWSRARPTCSISTAGAVQGDGVPAAQDRPRSMELGRISAMPFRRPAARARRHRTEPKIPCTINAYFNDGGRAGLTIELSGQYVVLERGSPPWPARRLEHRALPRDAPGHARGPGRADRLAGSSDRCRGARPSLGALCRGWAGDVRLGGSRPATGDTCSRTWISA